MAGIWKPQVDEAADKTGEWIAEHVGGQELQAASDAVDVFRHHLLVQLLRGYENQAGRNERRCREVGLEIRKIETNLGERKP